MWDQSLVVLFERGGPVMWPLLACSVLAVALILDRLLAFAWGCQSFDALVRTLRPLVTAGKWRLAERLCAGAGPYSQFARVYLDQRDASKAVREDILQREGKLILGHFETRVRWLGILGQISPMLGLLGTVTGLVGAFHQVEVLGGQVQPSNLASGIWEALLTTVFGLVIAIPCLAAYHGFDSRVQTLAERFSLLVSYLDQWCAEGIACSSADEPARRQATGNSYPCNFASPGAATSAST